MAPLTTLSAEAQRALKDLRLRSDTHGHLRACEQVARDADGDQRRASGHHEARADPLDTLLHKSYEALSAHVVSGVALDAHCRAARPLSTGSATFDDVLHGGLRRGEVVELSGPPASGKTQLCLSAAAAAAAAGAPVLFIDSTGGFSARRLGQLLHHGTSPHASLEQLPRLLRLVRVAHVFDVHTVLALLDDLMRVERDGGEAPGGDGEAPSAPRTCPALVVCDSASALLSPLLTTTHPQGRALMLSLAGALRALADEHNAAVLMTNHTVSGRDGDTGALKPALGETWKSQPHIRLQLSVAPLNAVRQDVHAVEVTLGRGRGRRAQFVLAPEGLLTPQHNSWQA